MSSATPGMGTRIRGLRRRHSMTQAKLAEKMGISASYLNLIEHGRRPLTAALLIKLAGIFELDLQSFAPDSDDRMASNLTEVFSDTIFDGHDLTNSDVRDFAAHAPGVARAVMTLYESFREARTHARSLASRVSSDQESLGGMASWRLPSEEVSDLIQRHWNYFPDLEAAAEALWDKASLQLHDAHHGLIRYLRDHHGITVQITKLTAATQTVRRFDPEKRLLCLSEVLTPASRTFQLAHQVGLLTQSELLDRLSDDPHLTNDSSRALCRVAMANYFAGALLMPYKMTLDAARTLRYDIEIISSRFGTSYEQVCHRLTTLRRPGAEGIPFHFLKVDIAGNISKRFSASGIPFARFAGACPRWNLVVAFLTPGHIRRQLSQMLDGATYFCVARTVTKGTGGFYAQKTIHAITLGCDVQYAGQMVYADGINLDNKDAIVPIGVTCRMCERMDCDQRVFPPLTRPLRIDENVRGFSFYATGGLEDP